MLTNSINSALNGLSTFENKLYESAQNISNFPAIETQINPQINEEKPEEFISESKEINPFYFSQKPGTDLTSDVVNMMMAEHGYKANLNVLQTVEDMSKSVINIFS
jgi:flagellar hook-associated protein FlgK